MLKKCSVSASKRAYSLEIEWGRKLCDNLDMREALTRQLETLLRTILRTIFGWYCGQIFGHFGHFQNYFNPATIWFFFVELMARPTS